MWVVFALAALLLWSGSDLFSKIGCQQKQEKKAHLKMVMAVGLVMGLHAFYETIWNGVAFSWHVVWIYLPVSLLYIISMLIGYLGLKYIELSISSPICNTSGALMVVFYLLRGENPGSTVLLGVLFTLIGVVGIGIAEYTEDEESRLIRQKASNMKYVKSFLAIFLPILYSLIDALGTYADSLVFELTDLEEAQANVAYELTFLTAGVVAFIYLLSTRQFRVTKTDGPKLIAAGFETAGQVAYIYAIAANAISAAPIISCYCVLTVVWSRLFLKEKLSWKHYVSIVLAFVGIIILAFYEEA